MEAQAIKGAADAQMELGEIYYLGRGVTRNYAKATTWFGKAARQGHPRAQCYLGEIHEKGFENKINYKRAVKWYRKAAAQGDAQAQYCLGSIYERGVDERKVYFSTQQGGVKFRAPREFENPEYFVPREMQKDPVSDYALSPFTDPYKEQETTKSHYRHGFALEKDYTEAVNWYQKAADQGHMHAQINLGMLYANGRGTARDPVMAYVWFKVASSDSDSESDVTTHLIEKLKKIMSSEQINEAERIAKYWPADNKK